MQFLQVLKVGLSHRAELRNIMMCSLGLFQAAMEGPKLSPAPGTGQSNFLPCRKPAEEGVANHVFLRGEPEKILEFLTLAVPLSASTRGGGRPRLRWGRS